MTTPLYDLLRAQKTQILTPPFIQMCGIKLKVTVLYDHCHHIRRQSVQFVVLSFFLKAKNVQVEFAKGYAAKSMLTFSFFFFLQTNNADYNGRYLDDAHLLC